jgi:hypothetical protein
MMPVTGKFDEVLFKRYRALPARQRRPDGTYQEPKGWETWTAAKRAEYLAKTAERSRLEGQLILENGPLVKLLTAQYRGEDNTPPRRGFTKAKREPGVEHLSWEEAFACGQTGLVKALRGLNLSKGGFTKYTAWKIRHELQSAITKAQVISVPKGSDRADRPKGFDFFEDEDAMQRVLLAKKIEEEGEDDGHPKPPPPDDDEPKERVRPASALTDFLAKWCHFGEGLRVLRHIMAGAYEYHARTLDFPVDVGTLERRLAARRALLKSGTVAGQGRGKYWLGVRVRTLREMQSRVLVEMG